METICAWCKKHIRGEAAYEGELVSHGMCEECEIKAKKEMEENFRKKISKDKH